MPDVYTSTPEAQHTTGLLWSKSRIENLLQAALDLLFPPCCVNCGRADAQWCTRCWHELATAPLAPSMRSITDTINADTPPLTLAATGLHDGILRQAIHALKYERVPAVAELLGNRLSATLADLSWPVDMIVPVPLGEKRLRERGYNQAQLIAEEAARTLGTACVPGALYRVRETQSQVGLNAHERQQNMIAAFLADPQQTAGRSVLIVDDVLTTGATLAACAQALTSAGAIATWGLTVTAAHAP